MLKRLFRWLWCAGPCKEVIFSRGNVMNEYDRPCGAFYDTQCTGCGRIKRTKFYS